MHPKWWLVREIDAMRLYYPTRGVHWMASKLGRSKPSIQSKARALKLFIVPGVRFTYKQAEAARQRDQYTGLQYFHDRVMPLTETGCWIWTGPAATKSKMPIMCYGGKRFAAARFAWRNYRGDYNGGWVWRTCGEILCVNPWHAVMKEGAHESVN